MIYLGILATLYGALLVVVGVRSERALERFRIKKNYTAAINAPSVSVCIPARNETHAMTQCLEGILRSDYQKLEILVFDDSSTDDTPTLIHSFARAGVRFIPGGPLPDGWLGRNHALMTLANEANGHYIMFMDVDTQIESSTISQLVSYIVTEKANMISVFPGRKNGLRTNVLFAPLRYFWEVVLGSKNEPATSSSLWMIDRDTFLTQGGFEAHKGKVDSEGGVAATVGLGYRALLNTPHLGVTYDKKWSSQVETSKRVLYPMALTGLKGGIVTALASLLLLSTPMCLLVAALLGSSWTLFVLSLFLSLCGSAVYFRYLHRTRRNGAVFGALLWPYLVIQDTVLVVLSYVGYKRGTVTWKGRSVTAPASRTDSYSIDR